MNYNQQLNELKNVFDKIESYDSKQNVGLRSLKNIGVWLSIYALTDEQDKSEVVKELAKKAKLSNQNCAELKILVDSLSKAEVLQSVIADYEHANGTFDMFVPDQEHQARVAKKIMDCHLDFLLPHLKMKKDQEDCLEFTMENSIKFNWAANDRTMQTAEYLTGKDSFCGEDNDFLFANSYTHKVKYGLVDFGGSMYHVAVLGTLQQKDANSSERTNAYIIEPVDPKDTANLQKHYFDIIDKVNAEGLNPAQTVSLAQANNLANVTVHGQVTGQDAYAYNIRFPQLAAKLQTTENRLGIYDPFVGRDIANIPADTIKYEGKRELTYDKKGGEIYNKESVSMRELTSISTPFNNVVIDYAVRNPFIMVYEANNGADYYPYMIANPSKNLENKFDAEQVYPEQKAATVVSTSSAVPGMLLFEAQKAKAEEPKPEVESAYSYSH